MWKYRSPALRMVALFILLQLPAHALHSQDQQNERKKIGLVLSGGGARGLAHIGVLEYLEKNRIPVDYIAGTSMGGLIGGLYAMGMSPSEMREFIRTIDWVKIFGTGTPYQDRSFRRKEDRRDYQVDLELGLRHGLSLPPGLSTGHEVGLMIDRVTLPYSTIGSFDELPIPFRCVSADLIHAEQVVMKDGLLSSAMRATMSIPGLFPPVKRDGQWLIDGGVLNNIPVDVIKTLHPDIVIVVNVGTPLGDERVAGTLIGVASQTMGVMTAGNERKSLEEADLIIAPDLGKITITDFSAIDHTADLGLPAAEAQAEFLKTLALDESSWQEYLAQRNAKRKKEIVVPREIQIVGAPKGAEKEIHERLSQMIGKPLDIPALDEALTKLTGEGRYQSIDYEFVANDTLQIRVIEKGYAPPTVNFALAVSGSDISDFNFAAGTRVTFYDVASFGSEWRNDVNIGFNSLIATEFYRQLGQKGMFVAPRAYYNRGKESFFSGGDRVAEFEVNRYGFAGDFGFDTWRTELRVGGELSRLDATLSTGTAPVDELAGRVDFLRAKYVFEGANSPTVPTQGSRFLVEARYYLDAPLAIENFPQLQIAAATYKPVGSKGTLFAAGALGTTFDKEAPPGQKFSLGGPFRLGAFDPNEFFGNHFVLISAGYLYEIYRMPPIMGGRIWAIAWYDFGGAFDDFSDADYQNAGSVGLVMDTKLGPFALIASYGEGNKSNVYFSFGKFF